MKTFVVFKIQPWESKHSYSLVDQDSLALISHEIILSKKEVEDKLYSTAELEAIRDEIVGSL